MTSKADAAGASARRGCRWCVLVVSACGESDKPVLSAPLPAPESSSPPEPDLPPFTPPSYSLLDP